MRAASHSDGLVNVGGSLPAFVARAQEDARCNDMLARLGYRKVKAAYARQLRDTTDSDTFHGLESQNLWPTMDFVGNWLRAEKRQILARVRWTFLGAMLATVVTGFTLAAILTIFR